MRMLLLLICAVYAAADQNPPASQAIDINNSGTIVGIRGGVPALWQRRNFIGNLPLLNGAAAVPVKINNNGDVVGTSTGKQNQGDHAVLWRRGRIFDLGTLSGDFSSRALDINDAGIIIGQSCASNNVCRPVVWTNLVITAGSSAVPDIGGAVAINNKGQTLFSASVNLGPPNGNLNGFAFVGSLFLGQVFTFLLSPSDLNGPTHMNDNGEVIVNGTRGCGHETDGMIWKDGTWSCFGNISLFQPGGCPTTPSFSTTATGLNNKGDIVGWVATPRGIAAQLEDVTGKVTVLPPLTPCSVTFPVAINDSGLIIGNVLASAVVGGPLQGVLWEGGDVHTLK